MLKKLLRFSLALAALLAVVVGFLLWNTTPLLRRVKPQLEAMASDAIGQRVELGELSLHIIPSIAIEAAGASLAGGSKTGGASIGKVSLKAKLGPLLRGAVEVSDLSLSGLQLHLTRGKDGSLKIGELPLGGKTPETPTSPPPAGSEKAPEASKAGVAVNIARASISESEITFRDELPATGPSEVRVGDIAIVLDQITTQGVGAVDVTASVLGTRAKNLHLTGSFTRTAGQTSPMLPGQGSLSFHWDQISLKQVEALLTTYGGGLPPGTVLDQEFSIHVDIAAADGAPHLTALLDATPASIALGSAFQKQAGSTLKLETELAPEGFGVKLSRCNLTLGSSRIDITGSLQPMTQALQLQLRSDRIGLGDITALLPAAAPFQAKGDLVPQLSIASAGLGARPEITGTLKLQALALTVPTKSGAGEAGQLPLTDINGTLEFAKDSVTIKPLTLSVANQKFEVGSKVVSLTEPTVQLALKSESVSLEALAAGLQPGGVAALKGAELHGVQLTGTYAVPQKKGGAQLVLSSGTLSGLPLGAVKLAVDLLLSPAGAPESLTLQPSSLGVFGGTLSASGSLAGMKQLNASVQAAKLDIAKASEFGGLSGFTGTLTNLNTNIHGDTTRLSETLAGPLHAEAASGTIPGVNILGETLGALKDVPGIGQILVGLVPEKYRPIIQANSTAYDKLTADVVLNGGNTDLQSLNLEYQLYHLTGSGTVEKSGALNINAQMRLTPLLIQSMVTKEPKLKLLLDKDQNLVIPLVIRKSAGGRLIVVPDVSDLGKRALTNTTKDAGKKALDKVAPGLGGAIDSLFR